MASRKLELTSKYGITALFVYVMTVLVSWVTANELLVSVAKVLSWPGIKLAEYMLSYFNQEAVMGVTFFDSIGVPEIQGATLTVAVVGMMLNIIIYYFGGMIVEKVRA